MIYKITTLALLSSEAFGTMQLQRRRKVRVRVKPDPNKLVPKVPQNKPVAEQHKPIVKPKTKPVSIPAWKRVKHFPDVSYPKVPVKPEPSLQVHYPQVPKMQDVEKGTEIPAHIDAWWGAQVHEDDEKHPALMQNQHAKLQEIGSVELDAAIAVDPQNKGGSQASRIQPGHLLQHRQRIPGMEELHVDVAAKNKGQSQASRIQPGHLLQHRLRMPGMEELHVDVAVSPSESDGESNDDSLRLMDGPGFDHFDQNEDDNLSLLPTAPPAPMDLNQDDIIQPNHDDIVQPGQNGGVVIDDVEPNAPPIALMNQDDGYALSEDGEKLPSAPPMEMNQDEQPESGKLSTAEKVMNKMMGLASFLTGYKWLNSKIFAPVSDQPGQQEIYYNPLDDESNNQNVNLDDMKLDESDNGIPAPSAPILEDLQESEDSGRGEGISPVQRMKELSFTHFLKWKQHGNKVRSKLFTTVRSSLTNSNTLTTTSSIQVNFAGETISSFQLVEEDGKPLFTAQNPKHWIFVRSYISTDYGCEGCIRFVNTINPQDYHYKIQVGDYSGLRDLKRIGLRYSGRAERALAFHDENREELNDWIFSFQESERGDSYAEEEGEDEMDCVFLLKERLLRSAGLTIGEDFKHLTPVNRMKIIFSDLGYQWDPRPYYLKVEYIQRKTNMVQVETFNSDQAQYIRLKSNMRRVEFRFPQNKILSMDMSPETTRLEIFLRSMGFAKTQIFLEFRQRSSTKWTDVSTNRQLVSLNIRNNAVILDYGLDAYFKNIQFPSTKRRSGEGRLEVSPAVFWKGREISIEFLRNDGNCPRRKIRPRECQYDVKKNRCTVCYKQQYVRGKGDTYFRLTPETHYIRLDSRANLHFVPQSSVVKPLSRTNIVTTGRTVYETDMHLELGNDGMEQEVSEMGKSFIEDLKRLGFKML